MRHGVESQGLLEQLSIELQELARVCRASIRDDKADIQIVRSLGKPRKEALLREVHCKGAVIDLEVACVIASHFLKQGFPSGQEHDVDSCSRDLPREFLTDSRRSARDERPRSELSFIQRCFHLAVPP